jgi:hypothetical protein
MSSPFPGAETAEFQVQKAVEAEPKPQQQQNPIVAELSQLLSQIQSWETNEQDVNKIWNFIKSYFSYLESKQSSILPLLAQAYSMPKQPSSLFAAIVSIQPNSSESISNMLQAILNLRPTTQDMQLFKLYTAENKSFLHALLGMIQNLPEDKRMDLNKRFQQSMSKYVPSSSSSSSLSFAQKEITVPGTKSKLKVWQIILIAVILCLLFGGGAYYYMNYTSSSSPPAMNLGGESAGSDLEISDYLSDS